MFRLSIKIDEFQSLFLVLVGIFAFGFYKGVIAQEESSARVLLRYSHGDVQEFNLNSGELGTRFNHTFFSIVIAPSTGQIYALESPSGFGFIPGESEIVEFDLPSGETDLVYRRNNIIGFLLSPDEEHIIVHYLSDEIKNLRDVGSGSLTYLCILDAEDGNCHDVTLPVGQYSVIWVGVERFVVTDRRESWYTIDFETQTPETLPTDITISGVADLGLKNEVFVSFSYGRFGYLNIATGNFRPYNLVSELRSPNDAIYHLKSSPDGQLLLFENDDRHYVLEVETGFIIAEFENLHNPQWLSNEQIIARYFPTPGSFPQEIVIYDFTTGTFNTLGSFEEDVFIVTMP
jgi:hypothetical protein